MNCFHLHRSNGDIDLLLFGFYLDVSIHIEYAITVLSVSVSSNGRRISCRYSIISIVYFCYILHRLFYCNVNETLLQASQAFMYSRIKERNVAYVVTDCKTILHHKICNATCIFHTETYPYFYQAETNMFVA